MAEAPINDEGGSDPQLVNSELKTSKSVELDVPMAQLLTSKTPPPAPCTPSTLLSGKRNRLKPTRFDFSSYIVEKKHSPSKNKAIRDPPKTSLSLRKEKTSTKDINTPIEISQTMIRAKEIQSTLGTDHPSFIKTMLRSHVASCFWMGLPVPFCKLFLPKDDAEIVIEDERGEKYNFKYIANRTGLSAGWRKFSLVHNLLEGDALIFQLVESCKFKIYIVRANALKEVDVPALNVVNSDAHAKLMTPAPLTTYKSKTRKKRKKPKLNTEVNIEVNSEVKEAAPNPNLPLQEVKSFKDFHIMVNNQCIDSELSEEIRKNYYNLCTAKQELLHENLPEGVYYKLVAGMIGETVNIANVIKNCTLTTTKEDFKVWDSSLKSFELMGMKVGFLRNRIRLLSTLVFESEDAKKYVEAKEEQKRNEYMIAELMGKLAELNESNKKIDLIVGCLKEKAESYEVEFREIVNAPW